MSHRNHTHTTPFAAGSEEALTGKIPGNQFGALVGTFHHWTLIAVNATNPNPHHIYVWVAVNSGEFAGKYEAAINVLSEVPGDADSMELRYNLVNQALTEDQWPAEGFSQAELSYDGLGLKEANFTPVLAGDLRQLVESYATNCDLMAVYGLTYKEGDGIHDIHMNSGNTGRSNHPNEDGAVVFYFKENNGGPVARWLFLKFKSENLLEQVAG